MNDKAWLARRAALAIALLVGFYLFGIGIALALFAIPVAEGLFLHRVDLRIAIACIGGGATVLWALVPRRDRFAAPGPVLDQTTHPGLFSLIHNIAARLNQEIPAETFLLSDVNAWVAHRGGVMGFGSRRVMGIGLPLLQCLSIREFAAVVAHEFGHFSSGDVRLGPWVYKTRAAIGRTLAGVQQTFLESPFLWYGRQFLRLTNAISREQELLADRLAAQTVGRASLSSALRRIAALSQAYREYLATEVFPVLTAGFLPPIATGFDLFLHEDLVRQQAREISSALERESATDPFDTHPSLKDRLAALELLDADGPAALATDERASSLIRDPDGHALACVEHSAGTEAVSRLKRIAWDEVARAVYEVRWRAVATEHAKWLGQFVVDRLPVGQGGYVGCGKGLLAHGEESTTGAEQIDRVVFVLGAGIGVLLMDSGWLPETAPGRPLLLVRGTETFDPMGAARALADGRVTNEQWAAQCQAIGVAGRSLGASSSPEGTRRA